MTFEDVLAAITRWNIRALLAVLIAVGPSLAAEHDYFGQAQSHLEEFAGRPLIAANWAGRHRPYVLDDQRLRPLMGREASAAASLDLYAPLALSATEVLMAGTTRGRPDFDIFLYDVAAEVLVNLTETPGVDEGRVCIGAGGRFIAYRVDGAERFGAIRRAPVRIEALRQAEIPGFAHCAFVDATTLFGVERHRGGYALHRCTIEDETVHCDRHNALRGVDHLTRLVRLPTVPSGLGVIARKAGEQFRRAFAIEPRWRALLPTPTVWDAPGDVLDVDGRSTRLGLHSRYRSSLAPGFDGVVYRTRQIGQKHFAIVATAESSRTLAQLGPDGWTLLRRPEAVASLPEARPALEIWVRSPRGERYQTFYVGPPAPAKVVVWWHGGPHENVSPRFHPYFRALNDLGFGVLAVNYPGSTGRGAGYERRWNPAWVADCLAAVWRFLAENEVDTVVSWSVSTGVSVQEVLLAEQLPVSALVDQAGWGKHTLLARAAARRVPVFTIRGRHDTNAPVARVDHWYPGGHDVTTRESFGGVMAAVAQFLGSALATEGRLYPRTSEGPSLLLDPAGVGVHAGLDEAAVTFELAIAIVEECQGPAGPPKRGGIGLTRHASARLRPTHDILPARPGVPVVRLRLHGGVPGASVVLAPGADATHVAVARRLVQRLQRLTIPTSRAAPAWAPGAVPLAPGLFEAGAPGVGRPSPRGRDVDSDSPILSIQPVDLADPQERARLEERTLDATGIFHRLRLEELAREICSSLIPLVENSTPTP